MLIPKKLYLVRTEHVVGNVAMGWAADPSMMREVILSEEGDIQCPCKQQGCRLRLSHMTFEAYDSTTMKNGRLQSGMASAYRESTTEEGFTGSDCCETWAVVNPVTGLVLQHQDLDIDWE